MRKRLYISYRGMRNSQIEELIARHSGAYGVQSAGQWGYSEGAFQCLFLYKKETLLDQFKNQLKRDLGFDYSRLVFLPH